MLNAVEPEYGLGVDISDQFIELARKRYPSLDFQVGDAEALNLQRTFDYVIISDSVGNFVDV